MSKLMQEKDIIAIARTQLPLVVEAMSRANLEAQKSKPDLHKIQELLMADELDGFYNVSDLLNAYIKLMKPPAEVAV